MEPAWLEPRDLLAASRASEDRGLDLLNLLKDSGRKVGVNEGDSDFNRFVSTEAPDSSSPGEEEEPEATPHAQGLGPEAALALPGGGGLLGLGTLGAIDLPPPEWAGVFTVMMRNLPNKFTQQLLIEEMDAAGFWGLYDFLYLPIDPETGANKGYSFLNFVDPSYAWIFRVTFEGRRLGRFNSNKVVTITPAALQGFEANYAHYSSSRVSRGDPAARPLFLREPIQKAKEAPRAEAGGKAASKRGPRRCRNSLIDAAAKQQQRRQAALPPAAAAWAASEALAAWNMSMIGGLTSAPPPPLSFAQMQAARPVARFCHACGAKMEQAHAFCSTCGSARIDV